MRAWFFRKELGLLFFLVWPLPICAFGHAAQDTEALGSGDASTTLIVAIGAGGLEEYTQDFLRWANQWTRLAEQRRWKLVRIGGKFSPEKGSSESEGGGSEQVEQQSSDITDVVKLQQAINEFSAANSQHEGADKSKPVAARLWLVLIGHGTATGNVGKFNLAGPDVTTTQLKMWLDKVVGETVVVDCTSSSAPFLIELSAPHRIVVTATRSGGEINYARFGGYMAEAISNVAADLDHDREVSLLEAFLKASKDTERFYRDNARLATEHALLDDNHDRVGTSASFYVGSLPTVQASQSKAVDGRRAARILLWSSPDSIRLSAEQVAERELIENQIDRLRECKDQLAEAEYYQQLETLLVGLTEIYDAAERN